MVIFKREKGKKICCLFQFNNVWNFSAQLKEIDNFNNSLVVR